MPDYPLLMFPRPSVEVDRDSAGNRRSGSHHFPDHRRQKRRLSRKLRGLASALKAATTVAQSSADGLVPEHVLVLETRGPVRDFVRAIKNVDGTEYLAEWGLADLAPDDDFYHTKDGERIEKLVEGHFYLSIESQKGMDELLRLWRGWVRHGEEADFPRGKKELRHIFRQLKDVRRWGPEDRVRETGFLEELSQRLSEGPQEPVRFETELWFRQEPRKRETAYGQFSQAVRALQGRCVAESAIEEIRYHGVLTELPSASVARLLAEGEDLSSLPEGSLFHIEHVSLYRPLGQCSMPMPTEGTVERRSRGVPEPMPSGEPVVALIDGLPLENHARLAERITVEDPDGYSAEYPASSRCHGTAMASIIIHGDLGADDEPLKRPVYVRPILKPDGRGNESIPDDELPVDLTWRAVRRTLEGAGEEPPSAPSVRIVNLSVGDRGRCFHHSMSPWARMIDWLAWNYKLLILASAGNHFDTVELNCTALDFGALSQPEKQKAIVGKLDGTVRMRRILSPSEAVNCLTVGATHEDSSDPVDSPLRHDPLPSGAPSTYSALGLGYSNAVKPDILAPGGRMFYLEGSSDPSVPMMELRPECAERRAPGMRVADPGSAGRLDSESHARGTSNATACATHVAAKVHEMLEELSRQPDAGVLLDEQHVAVLLKALLVHGAAWDQGVDFLRSAIMPSANNKDFRKYMARYAGHGRVVPGRILGCVKERATLVGVGQLAPGKKGRAHEYQVPLPPSLSGELSRRRFTVTLAWLTPMNCHNRKYRQAALYYTFPGEVKPALQVARKHVYHDAVKRGTVQHEVFESDGKTAIAVAGDQAFEIKVNARPHAVSKLDEPVPYALAVSLEVAEGVGLPVYDEVKAGIMSRVAARARADGS